MTMVKISADRVSKIPCRANRGGENPLEDRVSKFNEGLQTDSEEPPFFTRTPPLHDPLAPKTGLGGVAAAAPRQALSASCLHAWPRHQGQRDARSAGRRALSAGARRAAAAMERLSRAPPWRGGAMAPARPVVGALDGGHRPLARAPRVVIL